MDDTRVERWERAVQLPLTMASVLFVAAYAWPILDTTLDSAVVLLCAFVVWSTWALLVVDLLVRLVLAEDRWSFARRHPVDIVMVVLPVLRPLQLLRLLTLLKTLNRYAATSMRGRVGVYLAASGSLIVFIGALAILDAERGGPGPIQTFGDAVWWALATISTVGYGDMYPVTTEGRFVAAGLMVCGIGVLGVVTGSFASWLLERVQDIEEMERGATATTEDVAGLRQEMSRLREAIERR
jgi:voltage-gated potassium channel